MASAVTYTAVDAQALERAAMAPTTESAIVSGAVLTYSKGSIVPVVFRNKPDGSSTVQTNEVVVMVPVRVTIHGLVYKGDKLMKPVPKAKDEFGLTDDQAKTYRFALYRRNLSGCPDASDSKPYIGRLLTEPEGTPPRLLQIRGTFNDIFCAAGTFKDALDAALNDDLAYTSGGKKYVDVEVTVHVFINEKGDRKKIYKMDIVAHNQK